MNEIPQTTTPPLKDTNQSQEAPPKSSETGYTRKGKVARLAKAVRDKINVMLLDGTPYAEIITNLAEDAKGLNESNLTRWVQGGYKDWLKEQHRLEETRVKQEVAMDLACPDGGSRIHEATLQLTATRLTEMVRHFNYPEFEEMLRTDPSKFIPFLNALARISDAELACERHRLLIQERYAKLRQSSPQKTPGLTLETRQAIEKDINLM